MHIREYPQQGVGEYTVVAQRDAEGVYYQAYNKETNKYYGMLFSVSAARELCAQLHCDDVLQEMGF